MHKKIITLIGIVVVSGCSMSEVKETIGLTRQSPDEFMIVTNDPLQMPKDNKLVDPGAVKKVVSNRISPSEQAKLALDGGKEAEATKTPSKHSSGTVEFLSNIGPDDKDISEKIEKDNKKQAKNVVTGSVTVEVVNAQEEEIRINELIEKGEKVTGTESPTVKTRIKVSE